MSIDPKNLSQTAQLTFSEEFDGNSLNLDQWNTAYPWDPAKGGSNIWNNEEQWYINASYEPTLALAQDTYVVKDGMLHIIAQPTPDEYKPFVDGYQYTSGLINTHGNFEQTYGYFEMRANIPAGQGMWPAFWLLQPGNWPPEIDVMEVVGNKPNELVNTVHTNVTGKHTMESNVTVVPGLSDGMQTYGVNWQADKITWYLNGEQIFQADTPADLHDPMYMLVNLAVGGNWPGSPNSTTQFPATMQIDYVRAYREMPEGVEFTPPVQEVEPVPVENEDLDDDVDQIDDERTVAPPEEADDETLGETVGEDEAEHENSEEEHSKEKEGVADDNPDQEPPASEPEEDALDDIEPGDDLDEVESGDDLNAVESGDDLGEVEPVEETVPPLPAPPVADTGGIGNSVNWNSFIEAFPGFGRNGAAADRWEGFAGGFAKADKFAAKFEKFEAKSEKFAAKQAELAERMLSKSNFGDDAGSGDGFAGFAAASSSSGGRPTPPIFSSKGFEASSAKLDFAFKGMGKINDKFASFQSSEASDFSWDRSFAEGIAEQALSQSVFDFA